MSPGYRLANGSSEAPATSRISTLMVKVLMLLAVITLIITASHSAHAVTVTFTPVTLPTGNDETANNQCILGNVSLTPTGAAMGGGYDPVCETFYYVDQLFLGNGKALASLAIVILGLFALFGKLTYTQAMVVASGIALVFGATEIIEDLGGPGIDGGATTITLTGIGCTMDGLADVSCGAIGTDSIATVFNVLIQSITGQGGRAVAIVIICIVGAGAMYGKVSWTQALTLMAGVGLVFGGATLVQQVYTPGVADYGYLTGDITTVALGSATNPVTGDPVAGQFLNLIGALMSSTGISIATVAVMALGFAAMLGKLSWIRAMLLIVGVALLFGAADVVYILSGPVSLCSAQSTDPFTQVICGFMVELGNPMAKTIATIAIMILGVLSMMGKISWEAAFVVTLGIALVFGSTAIIEMFESGFVGVSCSSTAPTAPSTGNAIADVLCYIVTILYGPAGKALATVAVIMMGFGALMGKVSYSQALIVAVGIAVTFGAPGIVQILMPSADVTGCQVAGATIAVGDGVGAGGIFTTGGC